MREIKWISACLLGLLFFIPRTAMAKIETPSYQVIQRVDKMEVRDYVPTIEAEVEVEGERGKAIYAGFRMLADYIFGNNGPKQSIAMTAPVSQQKGEKIAMTAPVSQTQDGNLWRSASPCLLPTRWKLCPSQIMPRFKSSRCPAAASQRFDFQECGQKKIYGRI